MWLDTVDGGMTKHWFRDVNESIHLLANWVALLDVCLACLDLCQESIQPKHSNC